MQYNAKIKKDGAYADLTFTRKSGEAEEIYLGCVKDGALADRILRELYDWHQCNDEFKDGDQIVVESVGTFEARGVHVAPADEDTRLACMGVTRELPYRIAYDGVDGNASTQFSTLQNAEKYIRDRWQGEDYIDGRHGFHTDYGRYLLFGFDLFDLGKNSGSGSDRRFTFQSDCPHPSIMGNSRSSECVKCGKKF